MILQYESSNGTFVNEKCGSATCLLDLDNGSIQKNLGPLKKGRIYTPLIATTTTMTNDDHTVENAILEENTLKSYQNSGMAKVIKNWGYLYD